MTERNNEHKVLIGNGNWGTYEVRNGREVLGKVSDAGFHELAVLYINYHGDGYEIKKID